MGFSATKTTVLKSVGDILQIVALVIGGIITLNVNNSESHMTCSWSMFLIMHYLARLLTSTAANIICTVAAACTGYLPEDKKWMRLVAFWFTNFQSVGFATRWVLAISCTCFTSLTFPV